jgi:hypothetical protein
MSLLKRILAIFVAASLLTLVVEFVSGLFRQNEDLFAHVHRVAGHLMVDLVAVTAFLWIGIHLRRLKDRPFRFLGRLIFTMALCLVTMLSSFTGYLRPTKIETEIDRETLIRFQVLHEWAFPILIGAMLLFWLRRLLIKSTAGVGVPQTFNSSSNNTASRRNSPAPMKPYR